MWIYYFFAGVLICLSLLHVFGIFRFSWYVQEQLASNRPDYTPYAAVLVPCRGVEQDLKENLSALLKQNYPEYEVIFITDDENDPSLNIIRQIVAEPNRVSKNIVIAGAATDSGQKVHNLRVATAKISPRAEVIVLVDSDARPNSEWLRSLIAPLSNTTIGASTGYRWFVPPAASLPSQLRSVWNASIASALGAATHKNFCWGGSTAIRKSTFEKLNMTERWRGTVSDDFALTRALQSEGLPIHFAPACLVPAIDGCTFGQLLEFTNRQLKITRVYAPHLWQQVLLGSLFFCLVFFGGILLVVILASLGLSYWPPLLMVIVVYILGSIRALLRFIAVRQAIKTHSQRLWASLPAHLLLWPLASALFLWNSVVAGFSKRITWRGVTYDLGVPGKTVIISRD